MTAAADTDARAPPLHRHFSEDGISAGAPLAFTGISADKLKKIHMAQWGQQDTRTRILFVVVIHLRVLVPPASRPLKINILRWRDLTHQGPDVCFAV